MKKREITRSTSVLGSISYILRTPTRSWSLPQIILVQTKTMKVALNPNPMIVVTKLVSKPIEGISTTNQSSKPSHKHQKLKQRTQQESPKHDTHFKYIT